MKFLLAVLVFGCLVPVPVSAEVTWYTDEGSFLAALGAAGFVPVHEGFEDDGTWGAVRSTIVGGFLTAPGVTSQGVHWTSSSPNNAVTTGMGAAVTGTWGFYSYPHGDYASGVNDGWHGTSVAQPLVAIGGWVDTNTPVASILMFLDGNETNPVDFGGDNQLVAGPARFFGVVEPAGFTTFDFREGEGAIDDQKFLFGDDFTFAFGGVIEDCNQNGTADGLDIAGGSSLDCNLNGIPDECEIDATSTAPGGPFFCTFNCADDCNDNGILDQCEAVTAEFFSSPDLTPIGAGFPQSFTIVSPPATPFDVVLTFTAAANLGGGPDLIDVDLNGVPIGQVFAQDGSDCPEGVPDVTALIVPANVFNAVVGGSDATIGMTATAEVGAFECTNPTFIAVTVELFVPSSADQNGDGLLDECQCATMFVRGEVNGDSSVNLADVIYLLSYTFGGGAPPVPIEEAGDVNGDASYDVSDSIYLLDFIFSAGPPPPPPFPTPGC